MDVQELRDDAAAGKLSVDKLIDVIAAQQRRIEELGAKRPSVISSVLQSIGKQFENFTLESVIGEAQRWLREGSSCFTRQVEQRGLSPPARTALSASPTGAFSSVSFCERTRRTRFPSPTEKNKALLCALAESVGNRPV